MPKASDFRRESIRVVRAQQSTASGFTQSNYRYRDFHTAIEVRKHVQDLRIGGATRVQIKAFGDTIYDSDKYSEGDITWLNLSGGLHRPDNLLNRWPRIMDERRRLFDGHHIIYRVYWR